MPALFKLKDHYKENQLYFNRAVTAMVFIFLLLVVLVCRLVYLQIFNHEFYVTQARNNQVRVVPIAPTRGLIYDRNGLILAENMPTFSLEIIPHRSKNLDATIGRLAKIVNISEDEIKIFKNGKNIRSDWISRECRKE